jgi:hypothetical protein
MSIDILSLFIHKDNKSHAAKSESARINIESEE